jgi:hypothetical protein
MSNEIPLNTLDAEELLFQFKLMRALGYHSLWDADFQRELRKPLRKHLYYRLIQMSEAQETMRHLEVLKSIANRISFFSDPELFKKVMDSEEKRNLDEMPDEARNRLEEKHKQKIAKHPKYSESDLAKIRKLLK